MFWKESMLSVGIAVVGLIKSEEQFVDAKKNSWFPYYEFKIMNSFSQIQNELVTSFFMNFYEFIHTNFVFVYKTSNLFIRICEGFQHVMLRMACTVIELET